jgi:threonylcarbamoyladenosine tRNA methylthiotransferase MtaB
MASGFHVENFGCRAARADGEAVSDRLRAGGLCQEEPADADVVIVNTCSVTEEADREARAFIRRAHRLNPDAQIMVTGCYAQRAPRELASLAGVAAVVGNSHKALVPAIAMGLARSVNRGASSESLADLLPVQSLLSARTPGSALAWVDDRFAHSFLEEAQVVPGAQTRPNLKIQEGCGNRCTFCIIPQTRGSSRSLPADAVLRQVEGFVAAGGKELVLSGINLGRWGRDLARGDREPGSFSELVRRILEESALPRLRLSSIEPMDWDAEVIALMRDFGGSRLARHAHLPLQSGSDGVLRRMHRRYRPWHYAAKVEALLDAAGPEVTIGADVMVGFPGETDREFVESIEFIRALPFGYLHLFPFSPRPGTRAWTLHAESPVPRKVVEERMAALRALAAEKSEAHRRLFVGRCVEAITLHTPRAIEMQRRTVALSENFLPIEIQATLPANLLVRLRITGLNADLALRADDAIADPAVDAAMVMYA